MMKLSEFTSCQRLFRLEIYTFWLVALIFYLNLSFIGLVRADEPLLTIEKAVWTNEVIDCEYVNIIEESATVGPLFLWMSVKGKDGALKKLQDAGKLPIYHKWYRHTITGTAPEGVTVMIDRIPIPSGRQELIEKLKREISLRTFFNWRTWSKKENARCGNWVVKVVYADNSPVKCSGDKDCEYKIEIKRAALREEQP